MQRILFLMIFMAALVAPTPAQRTVTIRMFYPGGTPAEVVTLPDVDDDLMGAYFDVSNGCVSYGKAPLRDKARRTTWTLFCGTFKITANPETAPPREGRTSN